ncbi:MAG: hypothetical protein NZ697_07320 [Porticoccaceae bacterium]|nr:hypothetical protein [Porticoccaceae bacterium]
MKYSSYIFLCLTFLLSSACVTPPEPLTKQNSSLTQGNVQISLVKGVTTKNKVLEVFGAPNITTRDGAGREVWTYQRAAQVSQSSSTSQGGLVAPIAGIWSVMLLNRSTKVAGFESSTRMMTLIIKFDDTDTVADFSSRTSNF